MNKTVESFARNQIKDAIVKLPEDWQRFFKRMYSSKDLSKPILDVVDLIPEEKLDWALTQVESSLKKLGLP